MASASAARESVGGLGEGGDCGSGWGIVVVVEVVEVIVVV